MKAWPIDPLVFRSFKLEVSLHHMVNCTELKIIPSSRMKGMFKPSWLTSVSVPVLILLKINKISNKAREKTFTKEEKYYYEIDIKK